MDPTLKAFLVGFAGTVAAGILLAAVNYLFGRRGKRLESITEAERRVLEKAKEDVEKEKEKVRVLESNQAEMRKEIAVMNERAVPLVAAFQAMIVSGIRNHDTPELDEVLDKMTAGKKLTDDDLKVRKEGLLACQNDPEADEAKRIKAKILEDVERLAEIEKEEGLTDPVIETVLVSKPKTKQVTAPDGSTQLEDAKN